jgi:uncharacterized protein (UPF0147 family)
MPQKDLIDRDLEILSKNLLVYVGKGKETREILKQMGLEVSDITEGTRKETRKAAEILKDTQKQPMKRIVETERILEKLAKDTTVPAKIRELILVTALSRLEDCRRALEWKTGEDAAAASLQELPFGLELFLSEEKKVQLRRKRMGIHTVPDVVKEAAAEAQRILNDRRLDSREKAIQAADRLMEPLQPAVYSSRDLSAFDALENPVRWALWEIAHHLTEKAMTGRLGGRE